MHRNFRKLSDKAIARELGLKKDDVRNIARQFGLLAQEDIKPEEVSFKKHIISII